MNAIRTQTLIRDADVVVVRFGDKYRQWNAAFDAGYRRGARQAGRHPSRRRARPRAEGGRSAALATARERRAGRRRPALRDRGPAAGASRPASRSGAGANYARRIGALSRDRRRRLRQPSCRLCEHVFVALGRAEGRAGDEQAAGDRRRRRRPHLRCARGDGHQLPRGAGQVGPQPRARRALRLQLDDQRFSRMHPCLCLLLRSPHPPLPRLRRRPRLRARDRRQGQHPRGPAGGAGAADLEAGAGRARDEHRPLPVGREPLPVHARGDRGAGGGARRRSRC